MAPGGVEASTLEVDEGKGRARDRQGRRVLANCRVLENLESGIAGPLEVAREEESAGIDVLGAVDERIPADRRDLERTTAVQHCLADTVVQHHRPCNQREALYVDVGLPRQSFAGTVGELEVPVPFDAAAPVQHRRDRRRDGELRVFDDDVFGGACESRKATSCSLRC